ncbi:GNAT family N-acetyltransferase [Rhizobium sp. LjRoot30]|uniref:GNAT family N-acetyltransferase n=1 Tax=Rhizobium sp. LjRoot30 TaxID=3342320 RepID=UPI003ED119A3
MTPADFRLEVTDAPAPAELAAIGDALTAFNTADVGPSERQGLAVLLRDENGAVIGGLAGFTAWTWLYVQWLFVPEALRGQGIAGKLLSAAEAEAQRRGCGGAWIDTFSETALATYQKQGYAVFGALPGFPPGRTRWFLQKRLDERPTAPSVFQGKPKTL